MITVRYAKVSRPRLVRILPRPRLFRRLDRARTHPLVWVQGPPGSGKTTLVASWVTARRARALWVQLDASDGDLAAFFGWVAEAARTLPAGAVPELPPFEPEAHVAPGTFARRFFRALSGGRSPLLLVLDDYHEIPPASPLHAALREGLQELPEGCAVMVASRGEPPPELARFGAAGKMAYVGGTELALTNSEARGVVRLFRPPTSLPDEVLDRARGWAAGVVLLGAGAGAGAEHERVFDYLAEEVLARAAPDVRDVLLRTAIVPQVTAGAAAILSGTQRAEEILTDLAKRGYFTVRKDAEEPVFQYHDLFRAFLLARTRKLLGDEEMAALARTAARLEEQAGSDDEAVDLWAQAGAWDDLERLIARRAPDLLRASRLDTVARWIDRLPAERRAARARLLLWRSLARFRSEPARAIDGVAEALERFRAEGNAAGAYHAWSAGVDMLVFGLDDSAPLDRWIPLLDELRARFPEYPDPRVEAAVTASAVAALVHRQPAHPDLPAWEERALALALGPGDPASRLNVARQLAIWHGFWGSDLGRARALSDALAPLVASHAVAAADAILVEAAEAQQRMYRGEWDACRAAVERGLGIAADRGIALWNPLLLGPRAWGELLAGDVAQAERTVAELAEIVQGAPNLAHTVYHQTAGTVAIWKGELRAALAHGEAGQRFSLRAGMPLAESDCVTTRAVAASRQGDRAALPEALAFARRCRNRYAEFGTLLALADEALRGGDEAGAVARVREAFAVGRDAEMHFSVWLPRADCAELVALALDHGVEPAYAAETARRQRLSPGPRAAGLEAWPWSVRVEALGGLLVSSPGELGGEPARKGASGKTARKPLDLLRLLVALGPRGGRLEALADGLWPDAEGGAGQHALETTVYRLRKLLGDAQAVVQRGGRIALDPARVFVDAWAVEALLDRLEPALRQGAGSADPRLVERIARLYRGDLLADEGDEPPVLTARERLRARVGRVLPGLGVIER